MKDELLVEYSSYCNCWYVLRIPAWAIEMAGDMGYWVNDDGDEYVPYEMHHIEGNTSFATKCEAEAYMSTLEV